MRLSLHCRKSAHLPAVIAAALIFGVTSPLHADGAHAQNIVLVIGDGMGLPQVAAAAYSLHGMGPDAEGLSFEKFPVVGYQTIHSVDSLVPDSAASGTAMACGVRTRNGAVGVDADRNPVESILEIADARGMATGLVTSVPLNHATPACFGAHVPSRHQYDAIIENYLEDPIVDVILGGGMRTDGLGEDEVKARATSAEYEWLDATSADALSEVAPGDRLFGHFDTNGDGRLDYSLERAQTSSPGPRLTDLVRAAVTALSGDADGFFLMVEGGSIDWASHANEADNAIDETLELSLAVETLCDQLEALGRLDQTLIIVTADHETGGMTLPGPYGSALAAGDAPEVRWSTEGHTAIPVPVWAQGPGAEALAGRIDNTEIFTAMRGALAP
jgi:alkaline phosphatase